MKPVKKSDHDIVGGYIGILKIIDTCTFWIQCEKCIHLRKIHKDLKYAFQNTQSFESHKPKVNDLVIVEDIDLTYYRGLVRTEKSEDVFIVHLIDKDEPITVETSFLKSLPRIWRNLEEQGHLIKIYGILPNDDSAGNLNTYRDHNKQSENILSEADRIRLDEVQIIDDVYYGNFKLYIESVPSYYDEIVLEKGLALPFSAFDADVQKATVTKQDKEQQDKKLSRKKPERIINISLYHDQFLSELVAGRVFNSRVLTQSEMSTQEFQHKKNSSNFDKFEGECLGNPDLLDDIQKSLARRDRWTSGLVEDEDPSRSRRSVEEDRPEPAMTASVSKGEHRREQSPFEGYHSTSSDDLNRSKKKHSGLSKMFRLPKDPFCRSLKKKSEMTYPSDTASEERRLDPHLVFSDSNRQRRDRSGSRRVDHMEGSHYDSNSSKDVNRLRKPYSEGQDRPTSFQDRSSGSERASYKGDSLRSSENVKNSSPICGAGRGKFIDQLRKQFTGTIGLEKHSVSTHRSHHTSLGEDEGRQSNKSNDSPVTHSRVYRDLSNLKISREHSPIQRAAMMGGFSESSSSEEFDKYQSPPEDNVARNRYPPRINENALPRTHFLGEKKTFNSGPRIDDASPRGHLSAGKNMPGCLSRSRIDEDRRKHVSGDSPQTRRYEDRSPGSHSFAGKYVSEDSPQTRRYEDRSPGSHSFAGKHVSEDSPQTRRYEDRSPGSHSSAGKHVSGDSPQTRSYEDRSPGSHYFAGKYVSEDSPQTRRYEDRSPGSHSFAGKHVSEDSPQTRRYEDRSPGSHSSAGKYVSGDSPQTRSYEDRSPGSHSFAGKYVSEDSPQTRRYEDRSPGSHSFAGKHVSEDSPQTRKYEDSSPGSHSFARKHVSEDSPQTRRYEDMSPGSHSFAGKYVSEDSPQTRRYEDRSPGIHSFAGKHVSGDSPQTRRYEDRSPGSHSFVEKEVSGDLPRSRMDEDRASGSHSFAEKEVSGDLPRSRMDEDRASGSHSFVEKEVSGDLPRSRMDEDRASGSHSFAEKEVSGDLPRSRMDEDRASGSHSFAEKEVSGDLHRTRMDEDRAPGSHSFAEKEVSGDLPRSRMDEDRASGSHSFVEKEVSGDLPRSRMDEDRASGSHSFVEKEVSGDLPRSRMNEDRASGSHSFVEKEVSGDLPRSRMDEDRASGSHSLVEKEVSGDLPRSRMDEDRAPGSHSFAEKEVSGDLPRSRMDEDRASGSHSFVEKEVSGDLPRSRMDEDRAPGSHSFAEKEVSGDLPRSRIDEDRASGSHLFAEKEVSGDLPRSRMDEDRASGSHLFAEKEVSGDLPRSRMDEDRASGSHLFAEKEVSGDLPQSRMDENESSGIDFFSGETTSNSSPSKMDQVVTVENASFPRGPLGRAKFFASFLSHQTQVSSNAQPSCTPMESSLGVSEVSKTAVDANDNPDRYYDIEEPEYLNLPLAEGAVCAEDSPQEESSQPEEPGKAYEKLVQDSQPHQPQPVDTTALVKVPKILTSDYQPASFEHRLIVDNTIGQLAERMKMSGGILHGDINCQPVFCISELKLNSHILGNMHHKKLVDLTRCQMYGIPVLLDRRNLILVGTPNSGKTLTYVLSILSLLLDPNYYTELKKGFGPRCVFLTSNAQNANYVSQFCSAFCGAKMTIITTHGGGLELERKTELVNGCEILVSTPRCLLRLLRQKTVTNLNRLCHLVLDDCDTLFDKFLPELKDIFTDVMKLVRGRPRYGVQVAAVAERWSPVLEEMALSTLMDRPVLCITAHLEAALYARVKPITYFLPPEAKLRKVLELLDKSDGSRTVVMCRSTSEVKALRVALGQTRPDNVLVAHEEMSLSLIVDVSNEWVRRMRAPLLVATDQVLAELDVTNAQTLIHYSLPENKSYFSERFFCVKEHFYDRIRNPKVGAPECQVYILLDDTNEQQFPEVVNFMERLSTPIPDNIKKTVQNILKLREDRKSDTIVCENLFMFGECWKMSRCKRQHIFNTLRDLPRELPTEGLLKVKILHVHNPVHYSVRLLATRESESEGFWKPFPTNFALIAFKIASYFAKRETRFAHERAKIGDMVAIEVEKDILFRRAKIIDIINRDEKSNPTEVSVLLVDEGSLLTVRVVNLYYLPEEFHKYPQESYDVYLNNLQPVDFDNAWSFAATSHIIRSINELSLGGTDDRFFVAKIALTVGTNVIADWMHCYEWLELNRCHVILYSPRKMLLSTGLAVENPTHLPRLFSLALDVGIIHQLPKGEVEKVEEVVVQEERWAHLESDVFVEAEVTSIINPSLFFVNIIKFADRLKILQDELNKALNTASIKPDKIEVGMICAAHCDLDNQWNRAMITDVFGEGKVIVFFVDYGDSQEVELTELSLLPSGCTDRLPFQAIECDLIGLRCPDIIKGWPKDDIDFFEKLTRDDNIMKELFVKVCDISEKGEVTRGRHYSVIICDTSSSADILINWEIAIRSGISDPETWHHVKTARDLLHNKSLIVTQQSDQKEEKEENDEEEASVSMLELEGDNESWRVGERSEASPLEMIRQHEAASPPLSDGVRYLLENIDNFDIELSEDFTRSIPGLQDFIKPQGVSIQAGITEENRTKTGGGRLAAIEDKREAESVTGEDCEKDEAEECEETECAPPLKGLGVFHPELHWSQTDEWVRIKVLLSDVTRYQLDWDAHFITFCTEVNEKFYWFHIELFGPICPDKTSYTPRGLHFEIKLEKYVKGADWSRLPLDEVKFSWIKLDADFMRRNDDTTSLVEHLYQKGVRLTREGRNKTETEEAAGQKIPVMGGPPDLDSGSDAGSDNSYQYHDLHEDIEDD